MLRSRLLLWALFGFALLPAPGARGEDAPEAQARRLESGLVLVRERGAGARGAGRALGRLLATEIQDAVAIFAKDVAESSGAPAALRTQPRLAAELQGLAEGAGVPLERLLRMHASPRLAGRCRLSGFSARWPTTSMGQLLHVFTHPPRPRNVVPDPDVPFQVFLHVPDRGHPYLRVSLPGFVGAVAGLNGPGLGLSLMSKPGSAGPVEAALGLRRALRTVESEGGLASFLPVGAPERAASFVLTHAGSLAAGRANAAGALEPGFPDMPDTILRRRDLLGTLQRWPSGEAGLIETDHHRLWLVQGAGRFPVPHDLLAHLEESARRRYAFPYELPGAPEVSGTGPTREHLGTRIIPFAFDSPCPCGDPRADRVEGELWLPEGASGVVIQLPGWRERTLAGHRLLAMSLARRGLAMAVLPLPGQVDRAPDGHRSGEWTLSADLGRSRQALLQGATDLVALSLWLEQAHGFEPARQAVAGVSLGGHAAAVAFGAHPERFAAGVFMLAGGRVEQAFTGGSRTTRRLSEALAARGVDAEEAASFVRPLDPVTWADPARRSAVLLIAGREDRVVPPASVEALAQAYGGARILWLAGGHEAVVSQFSAVLEAMAEHLHESFER